MVSSFHSGVGNGASNRQELILKIKTYKNLKNLIVQTTATGGKYVPATSTKWRMHLFENRRGGSVGTERA